MIEDVSILNDLRNKKRITGNTKVIMATCIIVM